MTFPPKSLKWMQERSAAFQKGTQRKKMPMTFGGQKKEKGKR